MIIIIISDLYRVECSSVNGMLCDLCVIAKHQGLPGPHAACCDVIISLTEGCDGVYTALRETPRAC